MRKHHTTIVLITLFFAGLIVLWWADYAEVPSTQELEANRGLVLPELKAAPIDQVRKIEVDQLDQAGTEGNRVKAHLVFERRPGGWQMLAPSNVAADPSRIDLLAQNLKNLNKSPDAGTIDEPAAKYGLAPPRATVKVYVGNSSTPAAALEIGKQIRDRLYVRPLGKPGIEVVDARFFKGIDEPAVAWRERSIFNLATFQVAGLAVTGPGRDLKAERLTGHWRIVEPFHVLGDDFKFEGALGELTSLRVLDTKGGFIADDVRDPASYGLDKAHAVQIDLIPGMPSAKPQTLLVGKPVPDQPELRYVMRSDQDDVMAVDGKGLHDLGTDPNALRSKTVLDFDPARTVFLRIESLGRTFDLERKGTSWTLLSPTRLPADQESVDSLLKGLHELQTSEFFKPGAAPRPGLEQPSAVLTLWQAQRGRPAASEPTGPPQGEPTAVLRFGRQDGFRKSIFAQLAGDPTILVVPDAIVELLPKNALAFHERTLLDLNPSQVASLTITRDDQKIALAPASSGAPNQWRMREPVEAPADNEAVTKALLALTKLRAERLISDGPANPALYGLDRPTLTVSWTTTPTPRGTQGTAEPEERTLRIGARLPNSESSYATLSGDPLVFSLPEAVVLQFRAEFHSRRVLSFNSRQVERLDLRWPKRSLSFEHHPTPHGGLADWDPVPATAAAGFDLSRISALATQLGRLETRRFLQYTGPISPATGLDTPALTVEVRLKGSAEPRRVRVGREYARGEFYATTASGDDGEVFLLNAPGWAELIKPGETKPQGTGELPENVFAPPPGG
jgi:hypothetical protein